MNLRISSARRLGDTDGGLRWVALLAWGTIVVVALCFAGSPAVAQAPGPIAAYRVIVHPQNPTLSLDRAFVAQGFLKKITSWPHGGVIRPVDLSRDSLVRRNFSEAALGRSVSAVSNYWQQLIFSGRGVPPPELDTDDEVIRFVLREPGAIGYVSGVADLRGAKAIAVK